MRQLPKGALTRAYNIHINYIRVAKTVFFFFFPFLSLDYIIIKSNRVFLRVEYFIHSSFDCGNYLLILVDYSRLTKMERQKFLTNRAYSRWCNLMDEKVFPEICQGMKRNRTSSFKHFQWLDVNFVARDFTRTVVPTYYKMRSFLLKNFSTMTNVSNFLYELRIYMSVRSKL